jgi:hypothetical protein
MIIDLAERRSLRDDCLRLARSGRRRAYLTRFGRHVTTALCATLVVLCAMVPHERAEVLHRAVLHVTLPHARLIHVHASLDTE